MHNIEEYRVGRNFIRVGDTVKVTADHGRRNGYQAKVRQIDADDEGNPVTVHVVGPRGFRSYWPDRIQRVAQTKHGEHRECLR